MANPKEVLSGALAPAPIDSSGDIAPESILSKAKTGVKAATDVVSDTYNGMKDIGGKLADKYKKILNGTDTTPPPRGK